MNTSKPKTWILSSLIVIIIIIIDKCRPVRRNRGLSNNNRGPSITTKKLQEIYFEAAKPR